jgi:hypothetical protein
MGRTALALAAEKNLADAIHVLLDRGADGNKGTASGETPLLIAAREGCVDAVAVLLQHGCSAHLMSADGDLPLLAAIDCGHYFAVEGECFDNWRADCTALRFRNILPGALPGLLLASSLALLISGKCNINIAHPETKQPALLQAVLRKSKDDLQAALTVLCTFGPSLNELDMNGDHVLRVCGKRHTKNDAAVSTITTMINSPPVNLELLNELKGKKTFLFHFFDAKSYRTARGLILLGADPTLRGPKVLDPLLAQALRARRLDVALAVMERAPNFSAEVRHEKDRYGLHPALVAVRDRDPLFVRSFLQAYVNFNESLVDVAVPKDIELPKEEVKTMAMHAGNSLLMELVKRGFTKAFFVVKDFYEVGAQYPAMFCLEENSLLRLTLTANMIAFGSGICYVGSFV